MPQKLDEGRDRFRRYVASASPADPCLPLVHSTDAFALGNIIEDAGKLRPQVCDIYKPERLTYLFYGRPAYRPNLNEDPTDLGHYFPVCFIFKDDISISVERIFPFDSGAFQHGYYKPYLHKHMKLGDFLLEAHPATPGRVVGTFFSSNTNYIHGRSSPSNPVDPGQFEALSYEAIIAKQGANNLDSRGGGVELQTSEELDLFGQVAAVILPASQARSLLGQQLRDAGIEIISYSDSTRRRPNECMGTIEDLCIGYLVRKKLIDEIDV